VRRNYGMPKPEGYRKARRLMLTAERFGCPSSLSSTRREPTRRRLGGAQPERGDREEPLRHGALGVPVVTCVIGEGGSGGALAIGFATAC
jgi:acetyl-CoA carboxylase carboxyl transferase subunit alpha